MKSVLRNELEQAAAVRCAMRAFAEVTDGVLNSPQRGYRDKSLQRAAAHVGFEWPRITHRAIHDSQATRAIWHWLQQRPTSREDRV